MIIFGHVTCPILDEICPILDKNRYLSIQLKKYVDDVNLIANIIPRGCYWEPSESAPNGYKLTWSEQQLHQDNTSGVGDDQRTMTLIAHMSNQIIPGMKFTVDMPSMNASGRVPMLDLAVWMDGAPDSNSETWDRIRHSYYEKPTTSPRVFHCNRAYPWRSKIITLAEETQRQMLNMDRAHSIEERAEVLNKFLQKMADSDYNAKARREIVT